MKVSKWGNSLAVRLPAAVVAEKGLKVGDEIDALITLKNDAAQEERKRKIEAAWAKFDRVVGKIEFPADYKFDRDEANSRD